ncbi:GNAT family N-acetyltransferase [Rhodobacteraceae bacterium M382]|nr:GNAT family N-acetyltransferase [Rhodobacteraceae bacterium M382]
MTDIQIEICDRMPPKEALNGLLAQYYGLIVQRMRSIGEEIDPNTPKSALAEFWENADDYLPPRGCLVLARDDQGTLIGCGMLKCLDAETGELKRLFVTEAARGTGAGRKLVTARVDAARALGLKRLVVDTLTPSVEMRSMYPKMGFTEVFEPIETTTYLDQPNLRPHLHFFVRDIA